MASLPQALSALALTWPSVLRVTEASGKWAVIPALATHADAAMATLRWALPVTLTTCTTAVLANRVTAK